jgi:cystathionine beta-lyase
VDWDRFEAACADPRVRLFLLCNPHNPAGRVWTKDELQRMGEICLKHHVFVIADEIHCELVMPGRKYTPFASISKEFFYNSATCVSPTKGFNIAGLQIANIIVPDEEKRERIDRAINLHEICDVNPFGVIALQEAYTEGGAEWLDQLNAYIHINYQLLCASFPQYSIALLEGTYLAWMDISGSGKLSPQFVDNLFRHQHVLLNGGEMYGDNTGKYVRINLACPRSILEQAIDAMQKVL